MKELVIAIVGLISGGLAYLVIKDILFTIRTRVSKGKDKPDDDNDQ